MPESMSTSQLSVGAQTGNGLLSHTQRLRKNYKKFFKPSLKENPNALFPIQGGLISVYSFYWGSLYITLLAMGAIYCQMCYNKKALHFCRASFNQCFKYYTSVFSISSISFN